MKVNRKRTKRSIRNRDYQSVTPEDLTNHLGCDKPQGRSLHRGVYENARNEAAMSNKISSWLENDSGHSDDTE